MRGAATALERVAGASAARHPSYRAALVEVAVYLNAAITAYDVRREVDRLARQRRPGRLRRLRPGPAAGPRRPAGAAGDEPGSIPVFGDVPSGPDDFAAVATEIARAIAARQLLKAEG